MLSYICILSKYNSRSLLNFFLIRTPTLNRVCVYLFCHGFITQQPFRFVLWAFEMEFIIVYGHYLLLNPGQSFLLSKSLLFQGLFRGHYTTSSKNKAKDKKVHVAVNAFSLFFLYCNVARYVAARNCSTKKKCPLCPFIIFYFQSLFQIQYFFWYLLRGSKNWDISL